jgi:hypothetical protein
VESVRSDIATSGAWSSVAQPTRLAVPLWTRLTREYLGDVGLHRLRRCKVGITAGCVALHRPPPRAALIKLVFFVGLSVRFIGLFFGLLSALIICPLGSVTSPQSAMGLSLNMLIETTGGFDFTGADCQAWMREAGFSQTRVEPLVGADSMVVAIK